MRPDVTGLPPRHLFGGLKGIPMDKLEPEIERLMRAVDMWFKVDELVGTLSGGQKRRISVALALIGE
jgi:ABC-2 type transport system ATP-binding protein